MSERPERLLAHVYETYAEIRKAPRAFGTLNDVESIWFTLVDVECVALDHALPSHRTRISTIHGAAVECGLGSKPGPLRVSDWLSNKTLLSETREDPKYEVLIRFLDLYRDRILKTWTLEEK